jgi:hypothetical protein
MGFLIKCGRMGKGLVFCLSLASCSPTPQGKRDLPNYSDMSAAADVGRTPSAIVITNNN